jgi:hypothetical protein
MSKKLTMTYTRPSIETLWYFQTNPPQNTAMNNWLESNNDKVTFRFAFSEDMFTQVFEWTFTDEAFGEEFLAFVTADNLVSAMNTYNSSVGITSTRTVTDV